MRGRVTQAALQNVVSRFLVLAIMLLYKDGQASCFDLGITCIVEGFSTAQKPVCAVVQITP